MHDEDIRKLVRSLEAAFQMSMDIEAALTILDTYYPSAAYAAQATIMAAATDKLCGSNEGSEELNKFFEAFGAKQAARLERAAAERGIRLPPGFGKPPQKKGHEARPGGDPSKAPFN